MQRISLTSQTTKLQFLIGIVAASSVFGENPVRTPSLGRIDAGTAAPGIARGLRSMRGGSPPNAVRYFDTAISQAPNPGVKALCYLYRGWAYTAGKRYDKGKPDFDAAIALAPQTGLLYAQAGVNANSAGSYADALHYYQAGMKVASDHPMLLNDFAWFRATCPDATFRNGWEAVRMAKQACQKTKWQNVMYIDTLAAAQAEVGEYAAAASVQQRVLESKRLSERGRRDSQTRLELYKAGKPFRDSPDV